MGVGAGAGFSGAAALLRVGPCFVFEIRKRWEERPGQPPSIGMGCIGGAIESGETPMAALRREAREEVGCRLELRSAPCTVEVSPAGVRARCDVVDDGLKPALVWEVTDPRFAIGSRVAVFLARTVDDPQPDDLPAIVLGDLDLVPAIGDGSIAVSQLPSLGAELRARTEVPADGRLQLSSTLLRLHRVRQSDAGLFDRLVAAAAGDPGAPGNLS